MNWRFRSQKWQWALLSLCCFAAAACVMIVSTAPGGPADASETVLGTTDRDATREQLGPLSGRTMGWTQEMGRKWPLYVALGRRTGVGHIDPRRCALVVIDMQPMAVDTRNPKWLMGKVREWAPELAEAYETRLNQIVWPNLERLVEFFRTKEIPIIFTVLGDETVARITPRKGELVWQKPRTGAFAVSDFDERLTALGVDTLFITGVGTSHCVGFSALGAIDHGYQVILVKDATADPRPDHYEAFMKIIGLFGFVQTTDLVISDYPWESWVDDDALPPPGRLMNDSGLD